MTASGIRLVVGLGNPGKTYAATRHNVGYRVIEALESDGWSELELLKPASFMNTSGTPVSERARKAGFLPQQILVLCDDFAIPLGTLRLRVKGSSGGHNGLDSILKTFGTEEVPRLRLGIGPVPEGDDPADFVLTNFAKAEKAALEDMIERAARAVKTIAEKGFETAMNEFNKKAA